MRPGLAVLVSSLTAAVVSVATHVGFEAAERKHAEAMPAVMEVPETVAVPNLAGLSLAAARSRVDDVGLVVGDLVEVQSNTVPQGQVIGSIPERFTELREGLAVKLKVSAGVNETEVPDVRRKHPRRARKLLEAAGFVVEQKNILNEELVFDRVIRQEPDGGAKAPVGSTVTITVNTEEADDYY